MTTTHNSIDYLIEAFLKSKSSSYTIETKNYRLDICKKNIELTDSCEYIPLEKIIITVRDATFVTRRKELEKTQKKNSTVYPDINKKRKIKTEKKRRGRMS